jgi:tetratricopeptide (TPR) repeat protein
MSPAPAFNTQPFVVDAGRSWVDSSAFSVHGSYHDDHFRLHFNIGTDAFSRPLCRPHCLPSPVVYWYPGWWYYDEGYYGNHYDTFAGYYSPPDANLYPQQPAPPPVTTPVTPSTARELGDTYLRAGDARAAVKEYKTYLKQYPGDEDTTRALGLALLELGQTTEGVAVIATAYKAEPLLAGSPVPPDVYRDGDEGMRRNLQKVSIYANRVKSPEAWLTIVVLMQAQGRNDLARSMLDRALGAGLDRGVFDRMSEALR